MLKTIFSRLLLIAVGLCFSLLMIEAALQAIVFIKSRPPKLPKSDDGTLRILCFGESTTQDQYPMILEQILRQKIPNKNIRVIDLGKAGTDTKTILSSLPERLSAYRPAMVICMMGINDEAKHLYAVTPDRFRKFRSLYLIRLLWGQFLAPKFRQKIKVSKTLPIRNPDEKRIETKQELFNYIEALDFSNPEIFGRSLWPVESFLMYNNCVPELIEFLKNKTKNDTEANDFAFLTAIVCTEYKRSKYLNPNYKNNIKWLMSLFHKRLSKRPNDIESLLNLAQLYFLLEDQKSEKKYREQAVAIKPRTEREYRILADEYIRRGQSSKAVEILETAETQFPENPRRKDMLLFMLMRTHNYESARALIKTIKPATQSRALALERTKNTISFLESTAKHNNRYTKNILKDKVEYIRAHTQSNYQAVAQILQAYKVPLISVQYPMREIAPLSKILKNFPQTVFVDNCESFVRGVMEKGYDYYFADCFAGDFGHCTREGNTMLANNIAKKIVPLLKKQS